MRWAGPALAHVALALAGVALAALAHDAPLAPAVAREWLRGDALSALALILLGAHGLVAWASGEPGEWRSVAAAYLFGAATLMGHLAIIGVLLLLGGATLALPVQSGSRLPVATTDDGPRTTAGSTLGGGLWPVARRLDAIRVAAGGLAPLVATLCAGLGLLAIGVVGGEWRYGAPGAGAGLNSLSFALLLGGAVVASGALRLAWGRAAAGQPLAAVACLYALLRLSSLGPWNLGWLFAALVAGGAIALVAAWRAVAAPPEQIAPWAGLYLSGLAVAGVGLGSGAGVTMAGYALLTWPVVRLGLALPGGPSWARWLLTGAVPLTAPFVAAWMAVAAAVAGGLTLLAALLWAAALLAAVAVSAAAPPPPAPAPSGGAGELGHGAREGGREGEGNQPIALVAPTLSVGLGVGAPLVVMGLLGPMVAQLQGGLTPYGEITLWPWAGLIALDAARQPVATMPSLALAALMMILSALCWVALRLIGRGRG